INILTLFILTLTSCKADKPLGQQNPNGDTDLNFTAIIPMGSNSWVINDISKNNSLIHNTGIRNWTEYTDIIRTYFKTSNQGELQVGFKIKSPKGISKISVKIDGQSKEIQIANSDYKIVEVGKFKLSSSGYHYIEIQGVEKSGTYIADIQELLLGGEAAASVNYIPTSNHYFGRRGPSVHLNYNSPKNKQVVWFYNEMTIPEGEDVVGSFFMANGHTQGYFGIQVNSETEKRVLFSIWSAYQTDNPDQIPDDYKVVNLGSGQGVTVQDFGNEGSGKQCIMQFNWKTNTTYKFLIKGVPSKNNSTDYTAYFYAPELGKWQLVASLKRPKTSTYLTRLHSFLENFVTSTGYISRQVTYGNQWVYTTDKVWTEITNAKLTADATANNKDRLDFNGGITGGQFLLKNCGFFNSNTSPGTLFSRTATGTKPSVDFANLPSVNP
ncbi:MAG: DUF3472 domain-containing protein, partial [Tenacibaculum sp.]